MVVHPSLPVRNVQDLIALAKTRTLTYGSPGIGNTQHLISEMFNMQAGTKLVHVPYKGIAPVSSIVCEEFVRLPRARHSANRRAQKLHLLLGSFSIERRFL